MNYVFTYSFLIILLNSFRSIKCSCDQRQMGGWSDITIQCRDNDNKPVEWWFIYKPPMKDKLMHTDPRFAYITSKESENWTLSRVHISGNSMLQYTLAPYLKNTYSNHFAVLYYSHKNHTGSDDEDVLSKGLLMADELGGYWLGHSGPPIFASSVLRERFTFPTNELKNGHLLACLTLNLQALNEFASGLHIAQPLIDTVMLPKKLQLYLPKWKMNTQTLADVPLILRNLYRCENQKTRVVVVFKSTQSPFNTYRAFSETHCIFMDVYANNLKNNITNSCYDKYGVRKIDSITLKVDKHRFKSKGKLDYARFAVSGIKSPHRCVHNKKLPKWTCISNMDSNTQISHGGVLVCFENDRIWETFHSLINEEPKCDKSGSS